jgi:DNA-binding NarL/FixJ family response regulator
LKDSQRWLSQALTAAFEGVEVVGVAGSLEEARRLVPTLLPLDVALIDLGLPDGSGLTLITQLRTLAPACQCVVTSIFDDDEHVFPALRAGACGYLLKDQPREVLSAALQGIVSGHPPLSPAIARRVLRFFQPEPTPGPQLTERELETLRYIARGLTQAECARVMGLSPHTVVGYVKEVYRKLNVSSRAEAALVARDLGLA